MQELERALGRARVGALAEPQVAVDDADGGELREMMALGHHLRADDDVGLAGLDRLMISRISVSAGHQVGREQRDARLGKALGHLLGDALHARPAGDERVRLAALGALLRDAAARSRNGGS